MGTSHCFAPTLPDTCTISSSSKQRTTCRGQKQQQPPCCERSDTSCCAAAVKPVRQTTCLPACLPVQAHMCLSCPGPHLADGVRLAYVCQELVAQALTLAGTTHQTRNVNKLNSGGDLHAQRIPTATETRGGGGHCLSDLLQLLVVVQEAGIRRLAWAEGCV